MSTEPKLGLSYALRQAQVYYEVLSNQLDHQTSSF